MPFAEADIDAVVAWRPALVLSMTELREMRGTRLVERLSSEGIDWVHFPIRDFGAPDLAGGWPALSSRCATSLANGSRVFLHCRAGLGRSGMVALRLMVEAGEDPDQAIVRLREARPGAVETEAQRDWAVKGEQGSG